MPRLRRYKNERFFVRISAPLLLYFHALSGLSGEGSPAEAAAFVTDFCFSGHTESAQISPQSGTLTVICSSEDFLAANE